MDRRSPHAGAHGPRRLACAVALSVAAAVTASILEGQAAPAACGPDLRILVVSADGNETVLPAIRDTLDSPGTPTLAAGRPATFSAG
jgi:hypothetical protein